MVVLCLMLADFVSSELYRFGLREVVDVVAPIRIGVCVTGQIGRLELESKRQYLFGPLHNNSMVKLDVVFVLGNEDSSVFVNGRVDDNQQKYVNETAIKDFLSPHVDDVVVKWVDQPDNPTINHLYADNLGKLVKSNTKEFQYSRTKSHIRQWFNLKQCYNTFLDLEFAHGERYDAFIRLRDDGYLVDRINPFPVVAWKTMSESESESKTQVEAPRMIRGRVQMVFSSANPPDIILSACDSWGGYNDKGVVVGRAASHNYFNGFMDVFYLHYSKLTHGKIHLGKYDIRKRYKYPHMELAPEIYTKSVLTYFNMSVMQSASLFPLIPSRVSDKSNFGRCFRIFDVNAHSAACYVSNIPQRSDFIRKGKCKY